MKTSTTPEHWPPAFDGNISFNAQHSPMGAFMSFTCGHFATRGGFGAQIGKPGNQDLYIGVKEGNRFSEGPLRCLPFFQPAPAAEGGTAFEVEQAAGPAEQNAAARVTTYATDQIARHYGWATDRWRTAGFTFSIYTPFGPIPDPDTAALHEMRRAVMPAVVAELTIDNRTGCTTRTGVFAINFHEPGWRPLRGTASQTAGFALGRKFGVLGRVTSADDQAAHSVAPELFCRWTPDEGVRDREPHLLGTCPGLAFEVPAGEMRTLRLALGCFLEGIVTTGLEGRYLHARYFTGLEDVLDEAIRGTRLTDAEAADRQLLASGLSPDQQFIIAHATRSYYGSTQLLDIGGEPFWIVNEGEYCMMNTLDLSVDQVFWELKQNPWVVRNLLDRFVRHYSFVDQVKDAATGRPRPGGISFTHDMGVHNNFSPPGHSSYERSNVNAVCFSHMTAEQLCNWILTAACYVAAAKDRDWAARQEHVIEACFRSLVNRTNDEGFIGHDSARCGADGAEITTYDSLDHSLAQTRNNLYMVVKAWAAFRGLEVLSSMASGGIAGQASKRAEKIEASLARRAAETEILPAVFGLGNAGYLSRILPAAEGLVYAVFWQLPPDKIGLIEPIHRHVRALLKDPEKRNSFPDGGIRLSSTSSNSWMSKIAIFTHVARQVLHLDDDPEIRRLFTAADAAHVRWQTDGSGYWACSDQFVRGEAKGSRYYPRIIASALWLDEDVRQAASETRSR